MTNDTNDIILKPAKRLLLLYLIAFLVTLGVLGLGLLYLGHRVGLDTHFLMYPWYAVALIGVGLLCYSLLWHLTCSYKMSDECITASTGVLSTQHLRIALNQIVDYRIMRPLIQRIIGLGNLHIDTAGRDSDEMIMHQISYCELEKAALKLNNLLNADQSKLRNSSVN